MNNNNLNLKFKTNIIINGELAGSETLKVEDMEKLLFYFNNLNEPFSNATFKVFKEESKKNHHFFSWVLCEMFHDEKIEKILTKTDKEILKRLIRKIDYKIRG